MKRVAKTVGALGLVGCIGINSQFAVADDSGWYAGGNVGQSRAKIDDARITTHVLVAPTTAVSIIDDNRDTAYKLFGGYRYNKNFAVEGGYFDLGQFGFTATTVPAGTLIGRIKLKGLNLDAVGILPITEKFSAFGRLGLNYAQARDSFTGTVAVTNSNPSKNDTNYKFGAGLQYDFTESLGMRAEAERYRINDAVGNKNNIDLISLGLVYRFGMKTPASTPKAAASEHIVTAPVSEPATTAPVPAPATTAPAPQSVAVTPPPPPPAPRKKIFSVDSSADALFGFGRATLTPVGQQAINKFAADLKDAQFDIITVTGHTDRIGSHAYNMRLSTRRAEVVKAYMMESAGIAADKIATKGVNGAEPITKPGECKGKKATKKLIACLGPDRRVEVEVTTKQTSK